MTKKPTFDSIPTDQAISLWNQLASTNPHQLTHAHNPNLYNFYTQHLKLYAYYIIIYDKNQPIALLPLTLDFSFFIFHFSFVKSTQPTPDSYRGTANRQQLPPNPQPPTTNPQKSQQLFSLPHLSYGGIHPLSQTQYNYEEIIISLANWITTNKSPSGFYKVDISEIKSNTASTPSIQLRSLSPQLTYAEQSKSTYWMDLQNSEVGQLNLFSSNLRRKIRAASRKGVTVVIGNEELLSHLMPIYQKNMHRLGSPALGKECLKQMILACKKEEAQIAIAYHNNQPIGGGLWLSYAGFCENSIFATLAKYNHLYTSYALHWAMIQHAQGRGDHTYSFGRSTTDSTVANYKTQWPVQILPLYHNSTHPIKKNHPTRNLLTTIWKHLPSFLVNTLGPPIAKRIY